MGGEGGLGVEPEQPLYLERSRKQQPLVANESIRRLVPAVKMKPKQELDNKGSAACLEPGWTLCKQAEGRIEFEVARNEDV